MLRISLLRSSSVRGSESQSSSPLILVLSELEFFSSFLSARSASFS